jgi:fucose permease
MILLASTTVAISAVDGRLAILAGIMLIRGFGIALTDLTANTLTMAAENIVKRHLMGPLHAMFSVGSIAGSAAVALGLAVSLTFRSLYLGLGAALVVLAVMFVLPMRSHDRDAQRASTDQRTHYRLALSSPMIRLCGLLTGLSFAGEVVVADWTALYLRDERGVNGSFAAVCIVAFAIAMLLGRLLNAALIERFGVRRAIMVQGVVAIVGGAMIVIETSALLAMAGCALAGFGLAGIGPTALSVAGISLPDDPASAAGVTLAGGYLGLAMTPVISGLVADGVSTRATLSFVMVLGALCVLFARGMPQRLYEGT